MTHHRTSGDSRLFSLANLEVSKELRVQFFVALVWDQLDSSVTAAATTLLDRLRLHRPDWIIALKESGVAVACSPIGSRQGERHENAYVLPNGRGVALGTLFPRSYADSAESLSNVVPEISFSEDEAELIVSSRGQHLIEKYWGGYIAILSPNRSAERLVFRDPSGFIPCHHTRIDGVDVYFVNIADVEPLANIERSVNERFLRSYLLLSTIAVRDTGIDGIDAMLPGECVAHINGSQRRWFLWNPLEIAAKSPILDQREAIELTRRTVTACTHAWASRFDGITLFLSGGLDSSILANCLVTAPSRPAVLCQNFYASNPNSDERPYARMVAEHAALRLTEETTDVAFDLTPITRFPRSLLPAGTLIDKQYWDRESLRQRALGYSATFAGHGGDELFYRGGPLPGAVDHAWMHGITRRLFSVALDDSVLDQVSIWSTLKLVNRYGIRKQPWLMNRGLRGSHLPLLTAEFREAAISDADIWHPLYRSTPAIPPAKYFQASLISHSTSGGYFPAGGPQALQEISPLLSQPLMELSLRIPTYLLRSGGRDRSIARQAFASQLPTQIATRKTKAFADAQTAGLIKHNIEFVRETLLDGQLVKNRIVDRAKLESAISGELTTLQTDADELARYLTVEAWWQRWAA
jgi:asparagine synthase (glutamine-hydrolysing)